MTVNAGGEPSDLEPERLKQQREGPVEFIAEPAPSPGHDLVQEIRVRQRNSFIQVNAQVLERHGHQVGSVQCAQGSRVGRRRASDTDPAQILTNQRFANQLLVHVPTVVSGEREM